MYRYTINCFHTLLLTDGSYIDRWADDMRWQNRDLHYSALHSKKPKTDKTNPVKIWMDKCDTVIARNNVAKCRQTLFHSLYFNLIWQRIANMLQFLICCCIRYEQAMLVT